MHDNDIKGRRYFKTIVLKQRVVYKVNATSRSREILGEFQYANANLSLCTGPGVRYPEPEARMRHMHSSKIISVLSLS